MNIHNWSMTHTHIGEPPLKNCTTEKEIRLLGVKVGLRARELATERSRFSQRWPKGQQASGRLSTGMPNGPSKTASVVAEDSYNARCHTACNTSKEEADSSASFLST